MIPNQTGCIEVAEPAEPATPRHLRRLKWNELAKRGDFVADGRQGFELWEGPTGFRADAFVKTIYRRQARRLAGSRKSK